MELPDEDGRPTVGQERVKNKEDKKVRVSCVFRIQTWFIEERTGSSSTTWWTRRKHASMLITLTKKKKKDRL